MSEQWPKFITVECEYGVPASWVWEGVVSCSKPATCLVKWPKEQMYVCQEHAEKIEESLYEYGEENNGST